MKKKNVIIIVGAIVLLIILWVAFGKKKEETDETKPKTGGGTGTGGGSSANTYPIKYGQKNDLVKTLQERLNTAGASPKLTPDGSFGPLTQAAVKAKFGGDGKTVTQVQFESINPANKVFTPQIDSVEFATRFYNAAQKGYTAKTNSELVNLYDMLLTLDDANIKEYGAVLYRLYPTLFIYLPAQTIRAANNNEQVIINRTKLKMKQLYGV
ncbi:hypothetical protein QQ054_01070 [Oscillatoria amoena NRMC-F 0135]|nr:hypothetical protein [Oscillatoria amoena NRMC-F 0135]